MVAIFKFWSTQIFMKPSFPWLLLGVKKNYSSENKVTIKPIKRSVKNTLISLGLHSYEPGPVYELTFETDGTLLYWSQAHVWLFTWRGFGPWEWDAVGSTFEVQHPSALTELRWITETDYILKYRMTTQHPKLKIICLCKSVLWSTNIDWSIRNSL